MIFNKRFTDSKLQIISHPSINLNLIADNTKAFSISFGITFHNLGPKLVILSMSNALYAYFYLQTCTTLRS